ncbi:MAG: glycosyltransferase [Pirellulales bacterium]
MATTAPEIETTPASLHGEKTAAARVLHVINGEHYAGAERVQDLLAQQLPGQGFEVGFACVKPDRFLALRQSHEAPLVELSMRSRLDLRPVADLVRLIRRDGYALVHTHTPRAALVGRAAAALAGVPMIHHVHSPTSADSTHPWRNAVNTIAERISLSRIAAVIAVSGSMGRYALEHGISPQRVHVVHNGAPIRGPLNDRPAPHGTWTLGTVALFRPRKGLEILLESLAAVRSQGLPVRLRAVGRFETPEYETAIKAQVERLGLAEAVDWTGFTRNVNAELDRMDLLVLPSLFGEGLPMVVLEAMAAGVPVIGTRVEGVPEAIRDGRDGLLVEPGDAGQLARAIHQIITGQVDWQSLRASAHRRQAEAFSDRAMAAGVAQVYEEVLAG